MSEVLFSFLQFKFAQCCTWVMNKITKHNGVHRVTNLHTSAYQDEQKTTFIYYSSYNVVVIIQDSHVSGWWFESKDGQTFFPISFSLFCSVYYHSNITFLSLQTADILKMILGLYKLLAFLNMHIHLHYIFTKTVKLFQEIKPTVEKPCPLYILL